MERKTKIKEEDIMTEEYKLKQKITRGELEVKRDLFTLVVFACIFFAIIFYSMLGEW